MPEQIKLGLLIISLTLVSGFSDSLGFMYATNVWQGEKLVWKELLKSGCGFGLGTTTYWAALRYLSGAGVVSSELQTVLWFGTTVVGIALLSGRFLQWRPLDQMVAVLVLVGIGWLMSRTGG